MAPLKTVKKDAVDKRVQQALGKSAAVFDCGIVQLR